MRIKKHIAVLRWAAILLSALWYLPSQAQTTDSLSHYLETGRPVQSVGKFQLCPLQSIPGKDTAGGSFLRSRTRNGLLLQTDGAAIRQTGSRLHPDADVPLVRNPQSSPQRSDRDGTHGLRTIQGNPQQPVLRSQKPVVSIEQSE